MLKKLLKYDLIALFKYWWIAAITTFGISILGGFAVSILRVSYSNDATENVPKVLTVLSLTSVPIIVLSFAVFAILVSILIFIRYYKNFFTDEGYLTFTLPVKRTQLINSKIISSVIASIATFFVLFIDVLVSMIIGFFDELLKPEFWEYIYDYIDKLLNNLKGYVVVYALECIVILVLLFLCAYIFLFDCVAVACMIAKKAKVISALGIYYITNGLISAAYTIFSMFCLENIVSKIYDMPLNSKLPMVSLILFGIIVTLLVIVSVLYALQYYLLDRKLNLS